MQRRLSNWYTALRPFLAGGGLLVLAVLVVYGRVVHFDFTNYDDPRYVFDNPMVKNGLSVHSIVWGLTTHYYDFWHPLTWWSHMLDCQLFGLRPGMHHLVNLGFHLANSLLLYGILARITGACGRSLVVALLFAIHPLHVESVAWIAERKDVLSTFFMLVALGGYVGWVENTGVQGPKSKVLYLASFTAFALGLMAKSMIVTFPFFLLLLDFWPLQRMAAKVERASPAGAGSGGRVSASAKDDSSVGSPAQSLPALILEKWPFFALAFASALVTYITMRSGGDLASAEKTPLALRLANIPVAYVTYVIKLAYPHGLTAFYPLPSAWSAGRVAACSTALLAVTVFAWRQRNGRPWILFGWLFFLGTLVPVIGFVANGFHAVADRYTYIPSVGLFIAMVWTLADAARTRAAQRVMTTASVVAIIVLSFACHRQAGIWRNSGTLWSDCIAKTTNNAVAWCNLGFYYRCTGETNRAIACYEKAFGLRPDIFEINRNLGSVLLDSGRAAEATNYYIRAVSSMPDAPDVNLDLAVAEMAAGDNAAAVTQFKRAVELNPGQARPLYLRGLAFARLDQSTNAIDCFQAALRISPGDPRILHHLELEWIKEGNYTAATDAERRLMKLYQADTNSIEARTQIEN